VKSVEDPKRYSQAGQESGKDGDPHNREGSIVRVVPDGVSLTRSRDAEPTKAEETGTARGTAQDVAAHHEG